MSIYILQLIFLTMNTKSKQNTMSTIKDGRHLRSVKTQESIVNSTIALLMESPSVQWPTAEQVAKHSNIGLRTVFRQFDDMDGLIRSCHKKIMVEFEKLLSGKSSKNDALKNRITFLIDERIDIYSKYKNVFASSIMNIQKFQSIREGFIEGNLRLKKRFENIIPEVLKLSSLDQAYLDTSISFACWYRLSIFYKFSDKMIIDKFSSETNKLLTQER